MEAAEQHSAQVRTELFRYALVGGVSFLADFSILYLTKTFLLPDTFWSVYLATFLGFVGGISVNTYLSVKFVFRDVAVVASHRGESVTDFIRILVIGGIGLLLTELGMYIGTEMLLANYLLVKLFVTGVVFFWNYLGRKIFVFQPLVEDSE